MSDGTKPDVFSVEGDARTDRPWLERAKQIEEEQELWFSAYCGSHCGEQQMSRGGSVVVLNQLQCHLVKYARILRILHRYERLAALETLN
jgi:hypothetical protein